MPKIKAASLREHNAQAWEHLLSALEGLLAERDLEAIKLADIAERAGMGRATVYNYAKDKNALFAVAAERASMSIAEEVRSVARGPGTASERIRRMVLVLVRSFVAGPIHFALKRELDGRGAGRDLSWTGPFLELRADMGAVVAEGIEAGEFREVTDLPLTVQFMAGVVGSAVDHTTSPVTADLGRIADEATTFVLAALRVDSLPQA